MSNYGDEEIVELLNKYKKESMGEVYSGIRINGDVYHFHEYRLWDEKVIIWLPLRFIDMPQEIINIKYGHVSHMDVVKCSRDYKIDIMLSMTGVLLEEDKIEEELEDKIELLRRIQPGYEIYDKGVENNGSIRIGWFDYRANSMDIALYSMYFIFQVDSQMVIGKFSCNIYKMKLWKPVMMKIIYSINNKEKILKEVFYE